MKKFTPGKRVSRTVKIRSCDRALRDAEWVLCFSENGLSIRRLGERAESAMNLSWRSVIGHALIHRGAK